MTATDAPTPSRGTAARAERWRRLTDPRGFDLAIVGGGATGLGLALDAALRGFRVALVESHDFASGTSSRSTKLVHGGVRYLAQGNLALVREALRERAMLLAHAPHLAQPLSFVLPAYQWWEKPFYGAGLKLYDRLAGAARLGPSEWLDRRQTLALLPNLRAEGLRGGIRYQDGQFDDARLAIALARSAERHGALLLNHCPASGLRHQGGRAAGLLVRDAETGQQITVAARCVVNATGVWVDALRRQDGEHGGRSVAPMVAPSQGVHLVVDRAFWPSDHALLAPRSADGRVLFAVPWLGKTLLGTTDTPRPDLPREPDPLAAEVDFILREAARHLARAPARADVRSGWAGLRPLVRPPDSDGEASGSLSREHAVRISPSGLVTVTGGKWTTYRAMAEDVLDACFDAGLLPRRPGGVTADLPLAGAQAGGPRLGEAPGLHLYGSDAEVVQSLPGADRELAPGLSEAMVRFAARHEHARTVEDMLARRSRLLFLDAAAAARIAPAVAELLRQETGTDARAGEFAALAARYAMTDRTG